MEISSKKNEFELLSYCKVLETWQYRFFIPLYQSLLELSINCPYRQDMNYPASLHHLTLYSEHVTCSIINLWSLLSIGVSKPGHIYNLFCFENKLNSCGNINSIFSNVEKFLDAVPLPVNGYCLQCAQVIRMSPREVVHWSWEFFFFFFLMVPVMFSSPWNNFFDQLLGADVKNRIEPEVNYHFSKNIFLFVVLYLI